MRAAGEFASVRIFDDPLQLALRLTLLDLLLQPVGAWWLRGFILLLAAAGLLSPRVLMNPATWLTLAVLTGVRVIADWPLSDNHAYLLSYWCLACGLALLSTRPWHSLARNARLLIGLVFAFATFWKLSGSGDYASGLFFRVTMLTDPRFESFAQLVGGLGADQFRELQAWVMAHADGGLPSGLQAPDEPRRFVLLAQVAAWWNIAINLAIAITFLMPARYPLAWLGDAALILFCVVTYAIAPVASFGWLLIAMAVSQTGLAQNHLRITYVAVFAVILLYREIPLMDTIILLGY